MTSRNVKSCKTTCGVLLTILICSPAAQAQGLNFVPTFVDPIVNSSDGQVTFDEEWASASAKLDINNEGTVYAQAKLNWLATSPSENSCTYPGITAFVLHDISQFVTQEMDDYNIFHFTHQCGLKVTVWVLCHGDALDDSSWLPFSGLENSSLIPEGSGPNKIIDTGFIVRFDNNPASDRHWFPGMPEPGDPTFNWLDWYGVFGTSGFNDSAFQYGLPFSVLGSNEIYELAIHETPCGPPKHCMWILMVFDDRKDGKPSPIWVPTLIIEPGHFPEPNDHNDVNDVNEIRIISDPGPVTDPCDRPHYFPFETYPIFLSADANGATPTFSSSAATVSGAEFVDHGDGTAILTITPSEQQIGQTFKVGVVATDGVADSNTLVFGYVVVTGPGEPYDLYPPQYAVGVDPTVTLSWSPGDYVAYGGEYLGTPNPQKGNGHHVFIREGSGFPDWSLAYPLNTAMGRIVGTQDANTFDISAVYPGGSLELDTVYAWTVIESNDLNAPTGKWWWKVPIHYFRTVGGNAQNPFPADGATVGIKVGAALSHELTWDRGYYVASEDGHVVYFGTNFNDVNTATGGTPQTAQSYTAAGLELGKEYYWRVDEVNTAGPDPCIWPGDVRNFTVGDYRVVDEFSNYWSTTNMKDFWKINAYYEDYVLPCSLYGGGAWLDLDYGEMSYSYDNNDIEDQYGPLGLDYFSEVRYEFPAPADLTEGDAETTLRALALDYTGNAGNAADPNYDRMYVMLESADGNMAIVFNPDVSAQKKTGQFNIDLRDFSNAGVNVQNVVYLYLGFGIQCNPNPGTPGGEGVVNFDNIRVYPPRCVGHPGGVPYYGQLGDLNGDCTVDIKDMKLLSNAWLVTDRITDAPVPVADDDPCMMARWEFEGNWDNDPKARIKADSNGIAHGTPQFVDDDTRPQSQAGNKVAYFDHVDVNDYVICGTWGQDGNFLGKSLTLMVWAKQTQELDWWADMISKGESAEKLEFGIVPFLERRVLFTGSGVVACPATELDFDTWYHIAGTYEKLPDVNGGISRLYIDGRLAQETDGNEIAYTHSHNPNYDPNWCIGAQDYEGSKYDLPTPFRRRIDRVYYGYLDDVRVYDRQLSEEEIMWLAGLPSTTTNYYAILPPASYADISSPEPKGQKTVNFKDMAKLAQEWLWSALWP